MVLFFDGLHTCVSICGAFWFVAKNDPQYWHTHTNAITSCKTYDYYNILCMSLCHYVKIVTKKESYQKTQDNQRMTWHIVQQKTRLKIFQNNSIQKILDEFGGGYRNLEPEGT